MGRTSYFRKFVPDFASRTACITNLTKINVLFEWNKAHESARKYVYLAFRPLLVIFYPSIPTELYTVPSNIGYGGILFLRREGQLRAYPLPLILAVAQQRRKRIIILTNWKSFPIAQFSFSSKLHSFNHSKSGPPKFTVLFVLA